jgi:hypothetical protein
VVEALGEDLAKKALQDNAVALYRLEEGHRG